MSLSGFRKKHCYRFLKNLILKLCAIKTETLVLVNILTHYIHVNAHLALTFYVSKHCFFKWLNYVSDSQNMF